MTQGLPPEHARLLEQQRQKAGGFLAGLVTFLVALVVLFVSPLSRTLDHLQASINDGRYFPKVTAIACVALALLPAALVGWLTTGLLRRRSARRADPR